MNKPWSISEIYMALQDRGMTSSLREGNLHVNGFTFYRHSMEVYKDGQFIVCLKCHHDSETIADRLCDIAKLAELARSAVA